MWTKEKLKKWGILILGQTHWANNKSPWQQRQRWRDTEEMEREIKWCHKNCPLKYTSWIQRFISGGPERTAMRSPPGRLPDAVSLHIFSACLSKRPFVHVWVGALWLPWTAWDIVPLITFSCALKAITISLTVRKSVIMVHLLDRQGRSDKSSSPPASIRNCFLMPPLWMQKPLFSFDG